MKITTCGIIGHKWNHYADKQEIVFPTFTYTKDSHFRICVRCSQKQVKNHNTGIESKDWEDFELTKEELRQKKLEELGI